MNSREDIKQEEEEKTNKEEINEIKEDKEKSNEFKNKDNILDSIKKQKVLNFLY